MGTCIICGSGTSTYCDCVANIFADTIRVTNVVWLFIIKIVAQTAGKLA